MDNEAQIPQSAQYERFKQLLSVKEQWKDLRQIFSLHELLTPQFQELLKISAELLLQIEFAISKKLEQRVWEIIKYIVQSQQQVKIVSPDTQEVKWFFMELINFYKGVIKLSTKNYGVLSKENDTRQFIANLYCYTGELYESMERQLNSDESNFKMAAALYNKALQIYPYLGKYNFLTSTLMVHFKDTFAATYFLLRAYLSEVSYDCKENISQVQETNRKMFMSYASQMKVSADNVRDDYLRAFLIYLIKLNSIQMSKIGFEEMKDLINMFDLFKAYLGIINMKVHQDHEDQLELLRKIIQVTNFGLHHQIQSCKTCQDIKDNDLLRESIRFAYGIYINVLDFVLKEKQYYLPLVVPILYYLYDQPLLSTYILGEFPQLCIKLSQIYWYARENIYAKVVEDNIFEVQDKLNDRFHNYIYSFETPLLGLSLYKHVLQTFKKSLNNAEYDEQLLLYICDQLIPALHGMNVGEKIEIADQKEEIMAEPGYQKKLIIFDGMNVAIRYGQECMNENKFYSKGLQIALDYWLKRGHPVHIILPDFCFSESDVQKKRLQNKNVNKLPDDVPLLQTMKSKGYATGIPNWNYDDSYMIELGRQKGGLILTNDRYNDHIKGQEGVEREKLKEWIRQNCISYTFIQNELFPNPDFLKNM